MQHLLSMKRLDLTARMLRAFKFKDAPNMNREELIESMKANKRLILSHSRGKTDTVYAVGISAEVALQDVDHTNRQGCPDLPETLAVSALQQYFESPGRADNANLLASVYNKSIAAKLGGNGGRPKANVKARKEKYAERSQKISNHEATCLSALKQLTGPIEVLSQSSPARKRHRVKGPAVKEEARAEVKEELLEGSGSKLHTIRSSYEYPPTTELRTRKIVQGLGSQKFSRRAQLHLLSHTHDLGIQNPVFTVLTQLLDKLKPTPSLPRDLRVALDRCVSSRDEICREDLKMSREEGKQVLTAVLYGGAIPEHLASNEFLICLSKVSLYARWLAMSLLEDEFQRFRSPPAAKKNPDMSILAHLYLATEDFILAAWVEYLQGLKPTHLSLHFDGVRISLTEETSIEDLCDACQAHIEKTTGFQVKIREKRQGTVLQNIKMASEQELSMVTGDSVLEQNGNCIPAAIANMLGKRSETQEALAGDSDAYVLRSYKQCEILCNVKLVPHLQFEDLKVGNFLLHSEGNGKPHCVGLCIESDSCLVYDVDGVYKLSRMSAAQAIVSGADASTCVYFRVLEASEDPKDFAWEDLDDEDTSSLLSLEAGGRKRPAASEAKLAKRPAAMHLCAEVCEAPGSQSNKNSAVTIHGSESEPEVIEIAGSDSETASLLEDDGVVVVDAILLQSLALEVAAAAARGRYKKLKQGFACPCCPWRCFQSPGRVTEHLRKYHVERNQYCCSGTKQIKCILSLHDSDMIRSQPEGIYLQRSAQLLRQQVLPPLSHSINSIDKNIRLLLDAQGGAAEKGLERMIVKVFCIMMPPRLKQCL